MNAARHPQFSAIHGTDNGASIAPTLVPELNIPVAKDLSFFGKYSAVALIAAGKLPASPMASTALPNIKPNTDTGTAARPTHPNTAAILLPIGMASA